MALRKIEVWHRYPAAGGLSVGDLAAFMDECGKANMPHGAKVVVSHGEIRATWQSIADASMLEEAKH